MTELGIKWDLDEQYEDYQELYDATVKRQDTEVVIRNGRETKADNELAMQINVIKKIFNLVIIRKMIKLNIDNDSIKFYNLIRLKSKNNVIKN